MTPTDKVQPEPAKTAVRRPRKPLLLKLFKDLVEREYQGPTELFEAGLRLLVDQLGVDSAVMIRTIEQDYEAIWWAVRDNRPPGPEVLEPHRSYCSKVLDGTARTLIIRDAQADQAYRDHPSLTELDVRAYVGVPLRRSDTAIGVLCVQCSRPKAFTRNQVVLVNLVGNLLSKAMEIELLKQELHSTREALELTVSAMHEGALEAQATRLPSRGFLEVWLKAYLFLARRRCESMAVAVWKIPVNREVCRHLKAISDQARGEDLLVDLGRETFALLLPRTSPEGAEVVLDRVRQHLGPLAVGATIWHPRNPADRDDLTIRNALRRATDALRQSHARHPAGALQAEWNLPELPVQSLASDLGPAQRAAARRPHQTLQ